MNRCSRTSTFSKCFEKRRCLVFFVIHFACLCIPMKIFDSFLEFWNFHISQNIVLWHCLVTEIGKSFGSVSTELFRIYICKFKWLWKTTRVVVVAWWNRRPVGKAGSRGRRWRFTMRFCGGSRNQAIRRLRSLRLTINSGRTLIDSLPGNFTFLIPHYLWRWILISNFDFYAFIYVCLVLDILVSTIFSYDVKSLLLTHSACCEEFLSLNSCVQNGM